MKQITKGLIASLVVLVLLLAVNSSLAAERKSRKDRVKDKDAGASTSTGKKPAVPTTLPAPATGIPASPTSPVEIKVVRPQPGEELTTSEGFTFVIGTLPTDQYTLRCNDKLVDVFGDGAFVGYVPIKKLNTPQTINQKTMDAMFEFVIVSPKVRFTNVVYSMTPKSPSAKKVESEKFAQARIVESTDDTWVGMENGTGPDGKPLLNLGKVVFFPKGSRIKVKEKKDDMLLVAQPVEDGELWINERSFKAAQEEIPNVDVSTEFTSEKGPKTTTYFFPTQHPLPMVFVESTDRKTITIQFLCDPPRAFVFPQPGMIWGFDAGCQDGHTVVTVRFPPTINKEKPLDGLKIMVDPGHHPDPGAIGPRGTEERALTLLISKQLAEALKARGAIVTLSREDQPLDLQARHAKFKATNPDLVISIHLNSAKDNEDPRLTWGTQTIYLFGHSQTLASAIHRYLVPVVRGHDQGFVQRNLLVTRYPLCPTVLIEPTHIIMPAEEKKLLTPEYRDELAKAIVEGTSNFLLGETGFKR